MLTKSGVPILLFLFLSVAARSQTVQWASRVIDYSSQLTQVQYAADQVLGKPNVLPAGGENPNAWTPERDNREEFIKVGFENPLPIRQIAIAESYHPSALTAIYIYDENDNEVLVAEFEPRDIPLKGRMLNIFYVSDFPVAAVKLELDGDGVSEFFSIDAIAISDSEIQIVAEVEVPEFLAADIAIDRLSDNVNSEYKEYKPVLSPDGNTMYFSRQYHPENIGGVDDPEDIWFSTRDGSGQWSRAENIGPELNNEGPNFVSSVTPDGNAVILVLGNKYTGDGKMESGVSISRQVDGKWIEPVALEIEDEYNLNEKANFFLAQSRRTLLQSIQRQDSYGDRDLYVSFIRDDSTWTTPLNLGDAINTTGTESAPFLAADDVTMYFSSNGFSGYGGMDIYVTTRLDDTWTNWSEPRNMGPQINSEFEDIFFNIPYNSDFAYYSRGVSEDNTDIYSVAMPLFQRPAPTILVKGHLLDDTTGEPVEAIIRYGRLADGTELGMIENNPSDGGYELLLPAGERYELFAEAEGYLSESQNIDLRDYMEEGEVLEDVDIRLVPIEAEATITLNNIFFDLESAVLRSESYSELNRLAGLLKEGEIEKVEIIGHTDTTGTEAFNLYLSEKRAQSVYDYLASQGVDTERMIMSYYGEARPAYDNATREGRQKNRRVEFKILEP